MSEWIYSMLLRLYPSSFRRAYGEEALRLFRDRLRDERSLVSSIWLWIDLLVDVAVSVPRSYRNFSAVMAGQPSHGAPIFFVLEDESPSFGSVVYGMSAALVIYSVVLFLLAHGGRSLPIGFGEGQQSARGFSAGAPSQPGPGDSLARAGAGAVVGGQPSGGPGGPGAGRAIGDVGRRPLVFDVVSIHEDKSGAGLDEMTMGVTPDGFRARNVPLLTLLQGAYKPSEGSFTFRLKQIVGLPTWAAYEIRYDVDARVSEADLAAWHDSALQPEMLQAMLQAALADRFKLTVHREKRVVPVYYLAAGSGRPKLTPYNGATLAEIQQKHPSAHALSGDAMWAPGPTPGQQWFFGVTMAQLGTLLSNLAGRSVLDQTGLKGRYDVTYQIELPTAPAQTDGMAPPPPPSPDADFFRSQISTIVEGQLGLRLKSGTGPVETLVIDHVDQLSAN